MKPDYFKKKIELADPENYPLIISDFVHWSLNQQIEANRTKNYRTVCDAFKQNNRFARSIALAISGGLLENYKLTANWWQILYYQWVMQSARTEQERNERLDTLHYYFFAFRWNVDQAANPTYDQLNTVLPCEFNLEDGELRMFNLILEPLDPFPAGCVVVSTLGREYECSTREPNGDYRLIGTDRLGNVKEFVFTESMMKNMKRKMVV